MKEKKLYTCEICNTDYADKEKAKQCEKGHIKQVINSLKGLLGAIGLELVEIRIRDRKSRKKYGWKE